jgi:hypothetical protein
MHMKALRYWMFFQVLLGIWLFVSPYALGYGEFSRMTANDMILGALVVILGLIGAFAGEWPAMHHAEKKTA